MLSRLPNSLFLSALFGLCTLPACGDEPKPASTQQQAQQQVALPPAIDYPDSWLLGVEPAKHVAIIEDHSDALLYWLEQGRSQRTVLHIDTHDDSRVVNDETIQHLAAFADAKDYTTLKDKSGVAYSTGGKVFNIGNFLYAGYRLGVVREVIWVLPARPQDLVNISQVQGYLENVGFDRASAQTFHLEDGVIRGKRAGMPMVICTSQTIPPQREAVLLSLDIDYLMGKHQDPISSPMLQATLNLFNELAASKIVTDDALVSYSVHGGSIPVMHKYTGDYLAELLRNPSMLKQPLPRLWQERDRLLATRAQGDIDTALVMATNLVNLEPGNASVHMEQSFALLQANDVEASIQSMTMATQLDPSYLLGFLELALVVGQSSNFAADQKDPVIDQVFAAAGEIFGLPADGVDRVQKCANHYHEGEYRRAQIELFRLVEDSVSATELEVFIPADG